MTTNLTSRRHRIVAALAGMTAVALLGATSAQAGGETSALCAPSIPLTITPGFSPTPSSGSLTSHGETGSLVCTGTIGGQLVTGPGTVGLDETYAGADCLGHVGTGTATLTLPTTGGVLHMSGAATSHRTALALVAEVRFPGATFNGVGAALPTQGTCFLTPLRKAVISLTGTLGPA
jgi:hypothetical protein